MADPYGIDVALTPDGDLAVGPNGSLQLVDGLANAAQALRQRFLTSPGELPMHPDYGSMLKQRLVGAKIDPLMAAGIASEELRALVEADVRFVAATGVQIRTDPDHPGVEGIRVTLALSGGEQLTVEDLASPSIDEIDFTDAPTLEDFADDPSVETVDGESFALVNDDLPELDELVAEGTASTTEGS